MDNMWNMRTIFWPRMISLCGSLSQADYDKIFLCPPSTIVFCDNKITYLFSSTRLNDITTEGSTIAQREKC